VLVEESGHVVDRRLVTFIAQHSHLRIRRIKPFRIFKATTHALSVLCHIEHLDRNSMEEGQVLCYSSRNMGFSSSRQPANAKAKLILFDGENAEWNGVLQNMSNRRGSTLTTVR